MNICWVLGTDLDLDPGVEIEKLKAVGSLWGSWKTWRSYQTDNVICSDFSKARELIDRGFQTRCNLHIPRALFQSLDRPSGVKVYEGQYKDDIFNADDIISMHLAASQSDIVLLLGLDLSGKTTQDALQKHRWHVYHHLVRHAISSNDQVQWVIVDHHAPVQKEILGFDNVTQDQLSNVLLAD